MKSSKSHQLYKSSEAAVVWLCLTHCKNMQKGLEIASKKKKERAGISRWLFNCGIQ